MEDKEARAQARAQFAELPEEVRKVVEKLSGDAEMQGAFSLDRLVEVSKPENVSYQYDLTFEEDQGACRYSLNVSNRSRGLAFLTLSGNKGGDSIQPAIYYEESNWKGKVPYCLYVQFQNGQPGYGFVRSLGRKELSLALAKYDCTVRGLIKYIFPDCQYSQEHVDELIANVRRHKNGEDNSPALEKDTAEYNKKQREQAINKEIENYPKELQEMARKLITADYSPDPSVLRKIAKELGPWFIFNSGSDSFCLPNLAFLGEPGTGKSELARRLAEAMDAEFVSVTGSSLLGTYVGWTAPQLIKKLKELVDRKSNKKYKIFFIDEAYVLLNGQSGQGGSQFAQEAVEVLLKAMEDKEERTLSANGVGEDQALRLTVTLDRNTAIWFGGYEKEMRKGLSANRGLFRRVKVISLPVPPVDQLYQSFDKMLDLKSFLDENDSNAQKCKEMIQAYFRWAKSRTYAEFFGNYGGVRALKDEIEKAAAIINHPLQTEDIRTIIEERKSDLRQQYKTVIEQKMDRIPFLVYTDVQEQFDDYIGASAARKKLENVIEMICHADDYKGCEMPKGALLVGPPGTGKTFLAKCMAGELSQRVKDVSPNKDVAFIKVAATELKDADLVKALFNEAGSYDSAIIFIDEIDAVGRRREELRDPSVLIQLMNELDGFEGRSNLFVLAATNDPAALDRALVRPGRFDLSLEIGYPNEEDRKKLIREYTKRMRYSDELIEALVSMLRGRSPVDIKAILNEARILYYDCEKKLHGGAPDRVEPWFAHRVFNGDLPEEAQSVKTKVDGVSVLMSDSETFCEELFKRDVAEILAQKTVGARNPQESKAAFSLERNDQSLSSTAVHEVGHALVSYLLGVKIEKITVLSRGHALGYVSRDGSGALITKREYENQVKICLAGRAAEGAIYGSEEISGGASSDIQQATALVRQMVLELGMSKEIGPMALVRSGGGYLGGADKVFCSETTLAKAENEIAELLKKHYDDTLELLNQHRTALVELAKRVYKKEELSGEKFEEACKELQVKVDP